MIEGRRADLREHARQAGAGGDEADVLVGCASASIRVGAYEDARSILRAALMLDPENARAWALSGVTAEALGQRETAMRAYEAALAYDAEDPLTAISLARLQVAAGEVGRARALLDWLLIAAAPGPKVRAEAEAMLRGLEAGA